MFTDVSENLSALLLTEIKKMEAPRSYEAAVTIYQSTRRNMPQDLSLHHLHCQSLILTYQIYVQLQNR